MLRQFWKTLINTAGFQILNIANFTNVEKIKHFSLKYNFRRTGNKLATLVQEYVHQHSGKMRIKSHENSI